MIDNTPPVEIPHPKPMVEQVYVKKDWKDMKTFNTYEEAVEFRAKHGGWISKNYDGRFIVLFVEK